MPWCEDCSRYWVQTSLPATGECPSCGRVIAEPSTSGPPKAPWHFRLLVVAVVLYLALRAVQGIAWVVHHV